MNDENLRTPTTEEARERGRKGGKASARSRRAKSDLRKAMQALLDGTYKNSDGNAMTGYEAIASTILHEALNSDSKNWGKAVDYIMQMTNALKSDEELAAIRAQAELTQAKVEMLTGADTSAIDRLDEILKEMKDNAYSESKTE